MAARLRAISSSSSGPLRHGSRSETVRQLQENLKKLGYYTGSISGHYGTLTEAAVTKLMWALGQENPTEWLNHCLVGEYR